MNDPYSSNTTCVSVGWPNSSAVKQVQNLSDQEENANCVLKFNVGGPDLGHCVYTDVDNRVDGHEDEYSLDTMGFMNHGNDHPLAAIRFCRPGSPGNVIVDTASCMRTTSSCYTTSVCGKAEIDSRPGDQFHLFCELTDDAAYSSHHFGLQESISNQNKRAYTTNNEILDSPLAKKHSSSFSPRKPIKPKPSPSKDPQSIAAKNRRERISERLKILQDLVPNGTKVDLVTMLEKAISYVKFLQLQVKVLATDDFWPSQGGKAPEIGQVKEAIDAILSSHRTATRTKEGDH